LLKSKSGSGQAPGKRVLGLFAKLPRPGAVKTRLAAETSPEFAAEMARAFLLDTIERVENVNARRVLAYSPSDAEPAFAEMAAGRFELVPQSEGDLGTRMACFFADRLAEGADAVVLLGTDSPTLPLAFVGQAFDELAQANVILGPATDGGYYLIGCSGKVPPLFEGIHWGTSTVLRQSIARLADPDWRLALLPPWYDVDSLEDLRMLEGHLAAFRRAGIDPRVPNTETVLRIFSNRVAELDTNRAKADLRTGGKRCDNS
jgi:rSAM/selenodomain-associated transferase 1